MRCQRPVRTSPAQAQGQWDGRSITGRDRASASQTEPSTGSDHCSSSINKLLKLHDVRARRRRPSAVDVQRAVELYKNGLSTRLIAERLGFGASTICRALIKAGVNSRTRPG